MDESSTTTCISRLTLPHVLPRYILITAGSSPLLPERPIVEWTAWVWINHDEDAESERILASVEKREVVSHEELGGLDHELPPVETLLDALNLGQKLKFVPVSPAGVEDRPVGS